MRLLLFLIIPFVFLGTTAAFGVEPIMITISDMHGTVFDGKWTSYNEWKHTSLNSISFSDGTALTLRSAHQDNYIYFLVDPGSMNQFPRRGDYAIICLDTNDTKSSIPSKNDFCFESMLGTKDSSVLQGSSPLGMTGNFAKIPSPAGFIGISGITVENDPASDLPHPTYEFKIPTDLVGRSDRYGVYFAVYDSLKHRTYSWPDINSDSILKIPSPSKWGDMISPDKTLPEFNLPQIAFLVSFLVLSYITLLYRNRLPLTRSYGLSFSNDNGKGERD